MTPPLPKGTYFTKGPKGKKYTAHMPNGNKVHFGSSSYEHFEDRVPPKLGGGIWEHKDHYDKKRRKNYRARHSKIRTRDGSFAYQKKFSSSWFSFYFLW